MARLRLPRPHKGNWSAARDGRIAIVLVVLAVLGLEAYRYQLYRQVDDARLGVDKVRSEADALAARALELEPIKPMVERALAGILDPADGNLSHQELSPLLAASRNSGVKLAAVAMGTRSRSGQLHTQTLSLQVRGREAQILRFVRELEAAQPLIRVVAWHFTLKELESAAPGPETAGVPSADGLAAQFTILYYHR